MRLTPLSGSVLAASVLAAAAGAALLVPTIAGAGPSDEARLRFTVIGDSLTAGVGRELTDELPGDTWPHWVDALPEFEFVGGWATSGKQTSEMADAAVARDADVLVVLGGTNDLLHSDEPVTTATRNLEAVVATVDVAQVALVALPPLVGHDRAGEVPAWNAALHELADARGWLWIDPWAPFAAGDDYRWADGAGPDGIHPTAAVQEAVAASIAEALLASR